jgi:hypothetical protein
VHGEIGINREIREKSRGSLRALQDIPLHAQTVVNYSVRYGLVPIIFHHPRQIRW